MNRNRDLDRFGYCDNNPVNFVDYTGNARVKLDDIWKWMKKNPIKLWGWITGITFGITACWNIGGKLKNVPRKMDICDIIQKVL